jgi:hypothetical protein
MNMRTLFSNYWEYVDNMKQAYLWVVFIALQVPIIFVCRKAAPSPDLLIEGGKYKRPLVALEMAPSGREFLFKRWNEETQAQLRRALYWDFAFIPLYVSSGLLVCILASRYLGTSELVGAFFLFTGPVAGLFDLLENLIMLQVIAGLTADHWLRLARVSTVCKFGFIGLPFAFGLFGLLAWSCSKFLHN